MSRRYSINWDRKGWPGSEIQMYNGCPCTNEVIKVYGFSAQLWWLLRTALISRFYILLWLRKKCTQMHASISRFYILLWLRKKYTQMHCLNIEVLHSAMTQREVHPDACLNFLVLHSAMTQKEMHPDALPQSPGSAFCYDSERSAPRCTASISRFYILLRLRKKCTKMHCLDLQVLHSAMTQKEMHHTNLLTGLNGFKR